MRKERFCQHLNFSAVKLILDFLLPALRGKKIKSVVCNYKTHGNLLQQPERCNVICHWDSRYIVNVVWHNKNIKSVEAEFGRKNWQTML